MAISEVNFTLLEEATARDKRLVGVNSVGVDMARKNSHLQTGRTEDCEDYGEDGLCALCEALAEDDKREGERSMDDMIRIERTKKEQMIAVFALRLKIFYTLDKTVEEETVEARNRVLLERIWAKAWISYGRLWRMQFRLVRSMRREQCLGLIPRRGGKTSPDVATDRPWRSRQRGM